MSLNVAEAGLLVCAGFASGAVNAVAGGGTLITFPALVAVGYSPISANVTTTVAMTPGHVGGCIGYRRELRAQPQHMRAYAPATAAGGLTGALLLITTPEKAFQQIVPFLILLACGLLAAQPAIQRWVTGRPHVGLVHHPATLHVAMYVASIYGSYFGGGLGVMMLAILGIFVHDALQNLNALKTFLMLVVTTAAIVVFIPGGSIQWLAVLLVAPASLLGGFAGASVARHLPAAVLRWGIVALGAAVAVALFIQGR